MDEITINLVGLDGHDLTLSVSASATGWELRNLVCDRLPIRAGAAISLFKGSEALLLDKSLREQGLDTGSFSYVYNRVKLVDVCQYMGNSVTWLQGSDLWEDRLICDERCSWSLVKDEFVLP